MTQKSARQIAVQALLQVNQQAGYSNIVLDHALHQSGLTAVDRGFTAALFYGTLERKLTLDFIISKYSSKPLKKLSPEVVEILRISLYQLVYMDSVPESAAVNEGVRLTKAMKVSSASGFVNAVLRSFLRDGKAIPECKGNRLKKWEVKYSCPQWLIKSLLEAYGEEKTQSFLAHSLGRPTLYARVNTTKITANALIDRLQQEGVTAQTCSDLENCLSLSGTLAIEELSAFQEGLFHIQDKSSQICSALLGACPDETVLDLCAAPGSKSFTICEEMGNKGAITSCDLTPEKVSKITQGANRLGLDCIHPVVNDATVYNLNFVSYDRILCDVPCSGMGIINRKPEIKYKDPKDLAELPTIQKTILNQAAAYLKPGGTLLYSTCTLLEQENSQVVEAFLAEHQEFEPCPIPEAFQKNLFGAYDESRYAITFFPEMAQTDGFYLATLKKVR